MHLQVTRLRTEFSGAPDAIREARATFDRLHSLRLPRFVEPRLLADVQARVPDAASGEAEYSRVGRETAVAFGASTAALDFAINDQRLFDAIAALTGAGPIGCFVGRVYQMAAGAHGFDWHDDNQDHRLIGLSVNLGVEPYRGGVLQVADADSKAIVNEVANVEPGDAVIFRIDRRVVHRVTPIEGPVRKVAYAGWFCSKPPYQALLRERWRRLAAR